MFKVKVGCENRGDFEKFVDAFSLFFTEVVEQVDSGTTVGWLEATNFIVYTAPGKEIPMNFYQARDFAYDIGLLAGKGELQNINEPPEAVIESRFDKSKIEHIAHLINQL